MCVYKLQIDNGIEVWPSSRFLPTTPHVCADQLLKYYLKEKRKEKRNEKIEQKMRGPNKKTKVVIL